MGGLWPLAVYFAFVLIIVGGMIGLSYILGERHRDPDTATPYESGIVSTGSARMRFSVKFYLVAVFFVIFDLEAVFVFAWSVAVREVGWAGFVEAMIFIGVLVVTLVYLWREGALEWGPARIRRLSRTSSTVAPSIAAAPPRLRPVSEERMPTKKAA